MFSDEAWYDIEQAHNTQNDRNWSELPLQVGRSLKAKFEEGVERNSPEYDRPSGG
jgi:hypothetical protein